MALKTSLQFAQIATAEPSMQLLQKNLTRGFSSKCWRKKTIWADLLGPTRVEESVLSKATLKIILTVCAIPAGAYLGVAVSILFAAFIGAETEGPRPLGGLIGICVLVALIWRGEWFRKS
jgi:hypothetical protein